MKQIISFGKSKNSILLIGCIFINFRSLTYWSSNQTEFLWGLHTIYIDYFQGNYFWVDFPDLWGWGPIFVLNFYIFGRIFFFFLDLFLEFLSICLDFCMYLLYQEPSNWLAELFFFVKIFLFFWDFSFIEIFFFHFLSSFNSCVFNHLLRFFFACSSD